MTVLPRLTVIAAAALMVAHISLLAGAVQAQQVHEVDPEHFSLLFENSQFRVFQGHIPAGEETAIFHSTVGLNIWLTDARLEVVLENGFTIEMNHSKNEVQWLGTTWDLSLSNTGDEEARWLHIETVSTSNTPYRSATVSTSSLPFRVFEPETIEQDRLYPLVVFLHGIGERGTDNESQLLHGVNEVLAYANSQGEPIYLLAPQHDDAPWFPWNITLNQTIPYQDQASMPLTATIDIIQEQVELHPIDPDRIYLMGLSNGAFGAGDMMTREPELFAAGVLAAGGLADSAAARIGSIPIWLMHGERDQVVHPDHSQRAYEALVQQGQNARITLFPDLEHDRQAWQTMFSHQEMLSWMFEQSRN